MKDRKRFKIYHDEAKHHHTSHWDWDYQTYRELEGENVKNKSAPANVTTPPTKRSIRSFLKALFAKDV